MKDEKDSESIKTPVVILPKSLDAPVEAGDVIGRVEYRLNGAVVHTVPLIADRSVGKAGMVSGTLDRITRCFALLLHIVD
jgi:D-alanyl-D-alanine carboxypeptidase